MKFNISAAVARNKIKHKLEKIIIKELEASLRLLLFFFFSVDLDIAFSLPKTGRFINIRPKYKI